MKLMSTDLLKYTSLMECKPMKWWSYKICKSVWSESVNNDTTTNRANFGMETS